MNEAQFKVNVHYLNNEITTMESDDLESLAKLIITTDVVNAANPIFIELEGQKQLYNRGIFTSFIEGNMECAEFLRLTAIDGACRNTGKALIKGIEIDEGSLWWRTGQRCVLVDTDMHIEAHYNEAFFTDKF